MHFCSIHFQIAKSQQCEMASKQDLRSDNVHFVLYFFFFSFEVLNLLSFFDQQKKFYQFWQGQPKTRSRPPETQPFKRPTKTLTTCLLAGKTWPCHFWKTLLTANHHCRRTPLLKNPTHHESSHPLLTNPQTTSLASKPPTREHPLRPWKKPPDTGRSENQRRPNPSIPKPRLPINRHIDLQKRPGEPRNQECRRYLPSRHRTLKLEHIHALHHWPFRNPAARFHLPFVFYLLLNFILDYKSDCAYILFYFLFLLLKYISLNSLHYYKSACAYNSPYYCYPYDDS